MDKFIKYNNTAELHKELMNIFFLTTEDSGSYFYCYCGEEFGDCDLCKLIEFFFDPNEENLMDGLSPKNFLVMNFNNKEKLNDIANKILPFFEKMKMSCEKSLDFFEKEYVWTTRDKFHGIYYSLTLEELIENEKEMLNLYS